MAISWRPRRYPVSSKLRPSMVTRMSEVRGGERVFIAILGMGLIVFFVILGIVAILSG